MANATGVGYGCRFSIVEPKSLLEYQVISCAYSPSSCLWQRIMFPNSFFYKYNLFSTFLNLSRHQILSYTTSDFQLYIIFSVIRHQIFSYTTSDFQLYIRFSVIRHQIFSYTTSDFQLYDIRILVIHQIFRYTSDFQLYIRFSVIRHHIFSCTTSDFQLYEIRFQVIYQISCYSRSNFKLRDIKSVDMFDSTKLFA